MERTPIKNNAKLFDALFGEIQKKLDTDLLWLDYAFGKAERLVKEVNGRKYYTPNIYIGQNEYEEITPDTGIGNYSFFILHEPQNIDQMGHGMNGRIKSPFSLVFWFDLRTITEDDNRAIEAVKMQILQVLRNTYAKNGNISISKIYERAENVFKEYSLDEVDNQFLMHPFAALRFDGEAMVQIPCEL